MADYVAKLSAPALNALKAQGYLTLGVAAPLCFLTLVCRHVSSTAEIPCVVRLVVAVGPGVVPVSLQTTSCHAGVMVRPNSTRSIRDAELKILNITHALDIPREVLLPLLLGPLRPSVGAHCSAV